MTSWSDWAQPADPHTVLLFEAIGGNGKSRCDLGSGTTQHATRVRTYWQGCFWYSFYEKGAIMADFCRRARGGYHRLTAGRLCQEKVSETGGMASPLSSGEPVALDGRLCVGSSLTIASTLPSPQ